MRKLHSAFSPNYSAFWFPLETLNVPSGIILNLNVENVIKPKSCLNITLFYVAGTINLVSSLKLVILNETALEWTYANFYETVSPSASSAVFVDPYWISLIAFNLMSVVILMICLFIVHSKLKLISGGSTVARNGRPYLSSQINGKGRGNTSLTATIGKLANVKLGEWAPLNFTRNSSHRASSIDRKRRAQIEEEQAEEDCNNIDLRDFEMMSDALKRHASSAIDQRVVRWADSKNDNKTIHSGGGATGRSMHTMETHDDDDGVNDDVLSVDQILDTAGMLSMEEFFGAREDNIDLEAMEEFIGARKDNIDLEAEIYGDRGLFKRGDSTSTIQPITPLPLTTQPSKGDHPSEGDRYYSSEDDHYYNRSFGSGSFDGVDEYTSTMTPKASVRSVHSGETFNFKENGRRINELKNKIADLEKVSTINVAQPIVGHVYEEPTLYEDFEHAHVLYEEVDQIRFERQPSIRVPN